MQINYRAGTVKDSYAVFCVFEQTVSDLLKRFGMAEPMSWDEPEKLAKMWARRRPFFEHLAHTADQFWVAEQDGRIVGYARSVVRGPVQQLTEFFILPAIQSGGVGRELLGRAFPNTGIPHRSIIATMDTRAQARYLKAGVYPHFPVYYFWRVPEVTAADTDLIVEPISEMPAVFAAVAELDTAVTGLQREVDHRWFMSNRQGFIYRRNNHIVGYGYVSNGSGNGPFALLDVADFPAVLAHAETVAATAGHEHFGLEIPMGNQTAVNHLLTRGFRLDNFVALFMCSQPFGQLDHYILTSPPYFL
jgi:GNAT superfamily N-acetyltransferase